MTRTLFPAWRRRVSLACLTAVLAACGGGQGTADSDGTDGDAASPTPVAPAEVAVRGTVTGLSGTLVLTDGSGRQVTISGNGSFTFSAPRPADGPATVAVLQQPQAQDCTVTVSSVSADTLDVQVSCQVRTYPITVQLPAVPATLVLTSSLGESLTVTAPGTYTFALRVPHGQDYRVIAQSVGAPLTCSAAEASGTAAGQPIQLPFSCVAPAPVTPPEPPPPPPPPPPPVLPSTPAGLTVSYDVKTYAFTWSPTALATHYRLLEDPDGAGPQPAVSVGGNLASPTYTVTHAVLLDRRLNAHYRVQACSADGCSAPTAPLVPDLARAIGFFKASNPQFPANFGSSVALSADGGTLAVGARQEGSGLTGTFAGPLPRGPAAARSGAVYVFTRTATGQWQQQAFIKPDNTDADDRFGTAVALSDDGDTLVVGAPRESSGATTVDGNGADNSQFNAGAAYVFARTAAGWSQQAYLKANNANASHEFGHAVTISGSGDRVAIGAPGEDSDTFGLGATGVRTGAVYLFDRNGLAWTAGSKLKDTGYGNRAAFGFSLALSGDGETLAVGMPEEGGNAIGLTPPQSINTGQRADSGAVAIFRRQANNFWNKTRVLKASNPDFSDRFGTAVAINGDGTTVAVGALDEDSAATGVDGDQADNSGFNVGAVYVFTFGTDWTQQAYLKPSVASAQLRFGTALALSADGNLLAVGAPDDGSNAVGIGGVAADNSASGSGAVTLFARTGTVWAQRSFIKGSYVAPAQRLGHAAAVSDDGSTLASGALQESSATGGVQSTPTGSGTTSSGAVYLY